MEISGLFEIHISVDINDIHKFRMFTFNHKMKTIMAVSGYMETQLMLSKYKNGTQTECIAKAMLIKQQIEESGIKVLRTKVESMGSNKGVPENENIDRKSYEYFEYHLKFSVADLEEYKMLDHLTTSFDKCTTFVSYNAVKKELVPLVTLRIVGSNGSIKANTIKDNFMNYLKSNGFTSNEGIQYEFSVYDDNMRLDDFIVYE